MPEHGEILPHSLPPELSIVVASTTPGPLAALAVHEPAVARPLTQMDVNDGLAIRGPRAALVGFRMAVLTATYMSKPPIASEPEMNTPTLKVWPTVNGPSEGGLAGQLVAVVEDVIQTRPVSCA